MLQMQDLVGDQPLPPLPSTAITAITAAIAAVGPNIHGTFFLFHYSQLILY